MKQEIQIKDLTLEDTDKGKFGPDDVRRLVAVIFSRGGAILRGVFLDRIISVSEKQDIYLPLAAANEGYGLFHIDKRGGLMIAEFSGALENMAIRQAVDTLAEIAGKMGGGFFPGYGRIPVKKTTIICTDMNNSLKLRGVGIHDVRLTDNMEIVFIFNNTEVKKISTDKAFAATCDLAGKGEVIFRIKRGERIFCLDRVKNGKIKMATSDGIYTYNFANRSNPSFVEKDEIQPELPMMPISAYHELGNFTAIVGGHESNYLTLLPTPNAA